MPDIVFDIVFADSKWWFRSPSRESSFPSKIEAIEAALRSAQFQNEVCLRVHHETGRLEGELIIPARKPPPSPPKVSLKPRKEINRDTARSIQYYSHRPAELVSKRIVELDQEIPLEAFVYRGGAALTIVSLVVILLNNKNRWARILALIIAALQLQYSFQGRNPFTDILRRRGYRSRKEIEVEKYSLEALRGDFAAFTELSDPLERARKCLDIFL